jgi:hypothetical protein
MVSIMAVVRGYKNPGQVTILALSSEELGSPPKAENIQLKYAQYVDSKPTDSQAAN